MPHFNRIDSVEVSVLCKGIKNKNIMMLLYHYVILYLYVLLSKPCYHVIMLAIMPSCHGYMSLYLSVCRVTRVNIPMDDSSCGLNFDLAKKNEIHHYS